MRKTVVIAFLLFSIKSFGQNIDKNFISFWKVFRRDVLDSNYKGLDSLTEFPLIVKGMLDSDPVKMIGHNKFAFIFKIYLKQEAYLQKNNVVFRETELDAIKSKENIIPDDFKDMLSGRMRLGDLEFKKIKQKWKLVLFYINTE